MHRHMHPTDTLRHRAATVARSMAVGTFATGLDLVVLFALVSVGHLSPRVASVPALAFGIVAQFVGNKLVAFEDRSPDWMRQGAQFLVVEAIGFAANLALYDLAVGRAHLPYLPARLLTTTVVYFGVCLPLWSRIFRATPVRALEES